MKIATSGNFSRDYFDNGVESHLSSYQDYLSGGYQAERIVPKATAILEAAGMSAGDSLLDFGCAAGYFVHFYRQAGLDAVGLDVSRDALSAAPSPTRQHLYARQDKDTTAFKDKEFDLVVAKDVLEHIPESALDALISELQRIGDKLFVSVPITHVDGGAFIDAQDESDPSHVIRLSEASWKAKFKGRIELLPGVCEVLKNQQRVKANFTALIH